MPPETPAHDSDQQTTETLEPCPRGRTDYEECFAPFRYCPVKGCGRAEGGHLPTEATTYATECSACGERFTSDRLIEVVEHISRWPRPSEHIFTERRRDV